MKYLLFFLLCSKIVCSQTIERKYGIGITMHSLNYLETDFNLNVGCFYKKNYSQLNLLYAVFINPRVYGGYWDIDKNILKRSGIGYTHRYFPNKKYSFFTSFLEANISYLTVGASTRNYGLDSINNRYIPESINRNILNLYFGYGIGLNFLHHFSIIHSIGGGYSFVSGVNRYTLPLVYSERYQDNQTHFQINISVLYHLQRF